jgi:uncharacterized heparinase superfamily protein
VALRGPRSSPLAALGRQLGREWRAGPLHQLAIAGPRPRGLATRPRDGRPADAAVGERLLRGDFRYRGEALDFGPGADPWNRPSPSRRFAVGLHGFSWSPDLLATGEAGARELLRLWLEWRRVFGRYNDFAWSGEALERRVFHLSCAAPALLPLASEAEGAALLEALARQARHLTADPDETGRTAERLNAAALAGSALAGPAGERLLATTLPRLEHALAAAVLPDGVHASRSPERGLELFFDLLALDDSLSLRGAPSPVELSRAIDRLSAGVRFFALADGRLPAFHGGEAGSAARIAAALALEAGRDPASSAAPYGDFQRLEGKALQVIADVGAPPRRPFDSGACAQTAAIEVLCQGRRLIVGSGWSAKASAAAADLRQPAGGSCLCLGGATDGGRASVVKAERKDSPEGVWLDITHDAWRRAFGLDHTRRLFLDLAVGELRGEDHLTPAGRSHGRRPATLAIAFHLPAGVSASVAVDGRSALIRAPGADGWRLRSDAAETRVEAATVFEDGAARSAQTVVLAGAIRPANGARVRWKLSRDEG